MRIRTCRNTSNTEQVVSQPVQFRQGIRFRKHFELKRFEDWRSTPIFENIELDARLVPEFTQVCCCIGESVAASLSTPIRMTIREDKVDVIAELLQDRIPVSIQLVLDRGQIHRFWHIIQVV